MLQSAAEDSKGAFFSLCIKMKMNVKGGLTVCIGRSVKTEREDVGDGTFQKTGTPTDVA